MILVALREHARGVGREIYKITLILAFFLLYKPRIMNIVPCKTLHYALNILVYLTLYPYNHLF